MPDPRPGFHLVGYLPAGMRVVSMIEYQGAVLVACENGVWRLTDGRFEPLEFVYIPEPEADAQQAPS